MRDIAGTGGGLDPAEVFIVDIAEDRAAAERIAAAHGDAVEYEADLLQVEGALRHGVAEFVEAQCPVCLDVEAGQGLEHFQSGDTGRSREQCFASHTHGVGYRVLSDGIGGGGHAAAGDDDFFRIGGRLRQGAGRRSGSNQKSKQFASEWLCHESPFGSRWSGTCVDSGEDARIIHANPKRP